MQIVWKPNPLETIVILDDHDAQLLRLRLEVEDLEERIFHAHFTLNPKDRTWYNEHVSTSTANIQTGTC